MRKNILVNCQGNEAKSCVVKNLSFSKDVYLLDEPFSALDAITRSKIHKWYLDIVEKLKMSAIFITHDIDEAIMLSDRIYIMSGSPGKITNEIHIEAERNRSTKFATSETFINYKKKILEVFYDDNVI